MAQYDYNAKKAMMTLQDFIGYKLHSFSMLNFH